MMRKVIQWLEAKLGKRWFIWLVILLVWLVFELLAASNALSSKHEDASGWWQVVIELLGFPALFYGLNELRKRVLQEQWKPEFSVGVVPTQLSRTEVLKTNPLPADLTVDPGEETPQFQLVVRNQGKLAARSVKIELELLRTSGDENQLILSGIDFVADSSWRTYSCSCRGIAGRDLVIRAGDDEAFTFLVHPIGAHLPFRPTSDVRINLLCRVWADGLDTSPHEKVMIVRFVRGQESR